MRQWNISSVLDPKAPRNTPYALILLNTPISEKHAIVFYRVWQQAATRIVADGAANMLLEFMDAHKDKLFKMPDLICGDLDSISDHARSYFEERVCPAAYTACTHTTTSVPIFDRPSKIYTTFGAGRRHFIVAI